MLAHFIGGPAHGHEEVVSGHPHRIFQFPEFDTDLPHMCVMDEEVGFTSEPGFIIHEYRLLYTDPRWAVYQWAPPRVAASWEFTIRSRGPVADSLYEKLHTLTKEGETPFLTACEWDGREVRVRGTALVDGPPDAVAVKQAAEDVQRLIDRKLRGYRVSAVVVEVNDG
jgi:hypothetical protein